VHFDGTSTLSLHIGDLRRESWLLRTTEEKLWLKAGDSAGKLGSLATILTMISGAENRFWRWVVPTYLKRHEEENRRSFRMSRMLRMLQKLTHDVVTTPNATMVTVMPNTDQIHHGEDDHVLVALRHHGIGRKALSQLESMGMTGRSFGA
jgi:hypothetical protein